MIEHLKSAGDQLRTAWENYFQVYSSLETQYHPRNVPDGLLSEISHHLDTELEFISSYEAKIPRIKLAISHARNYLLDNVSIMSFPPEILARVFHFARVQPCKLHRLSGNDITHYPTYPYNLTQVCSLWRRTAISFRPLWDHIDWCPYGAFQAGFLARAATHVARAGNLPIEIHIAANDDSSIELFCTGQEDLFQLISRISSRVESFDFTVTGEMQSVDCSILRELVFSENLALTKLALRSEAHRYNTFIMPDSFESPEPDGLAINVYPGQFEDGFAPITTLYLNSIFPIWSSKAYHRLVDLRLVSKHNEKIIKEAELITIFHSSPGLQILHLGLGIYKLLPDDEEVTPVHLQDLQVIRILPYGSKASIPRPSNVLRLLAPGTKSIRLSFGGHYKRESILLKELERFFARSRVERFHARGTFPPIGPLLRHAAHIECVVLDDFDFSFRDGIRSSRAQMREVAESSRLKSLHIVRSNLSEDDLHFLLECCPDGIVLYSCHVRLDEDSQCETISVQGLSDNFSTIRDTDYNPYPRMDTTRDWDIIE